MTKKIAICGVGRLGLPLALNFAEVETAEVIGFDVDENHIKALNDSSFQTEEPEVNNLLRKGRVKFTTNVNTLLDVDFIVACVRTDSLSSGAYDLQQLWKLVEMLANLWNSTKRINKKCAMVINCNVNPGTSRIIAEMVGPLGVEVYFWPEWVKQGSVVYDQTHPEVAILGTSPEYETISMVRSTIAKLDVLGKCKKIHELNLIDAELAKICLNCFLTVKISFANMIGNLLDEVGIDASSVLAAIAGDTRIGPQFFQPGFGYGGPCLPRDNAALLNFAANFGVELPLCSAADKVNTQRQQSLLKTAVKSYHQTGMRPEIECLSYKKGVPIYTESQQLEHVSSLAALGVPSALLNSRDFEYGRLAINRGNYFLRIKNEK